MTTEIPTTPSLKKYETKWLSILEMNSTELQKKEQKPIWSNEKLREDHQHHN